MFEYFLNLINFADINESYGDFDDIIIPLRYKLRSFVILWLFDSGKTAKVTTKIEYCLKKSNFFKYAFIVLDYVY